MSSPDFKEGTGVVGIGVSFYGVDVVSQESHPIKRMAAGIIFDGHPYSFPLQSPAKRVSFLGAGGGDSPAKPAILKETEGYIWQYESSRPRAQMVRWKSYFENRIMIG